MRKDLQVQFNKFHENIKLNDIEDNKILRDKREMLVDEIKEFLNKKFKNEESKRPTFSVFNQGSYSMSTGVKPLDGDYDIDVGLSFNFSKDDYEPVVVKEWVHDALNKTNRTVKIRRPCVTVQYSKKGEDTYHVDFAIYSDADYNSNGKTYLAKGFSGSSAKNKHWEVSNPKELKKVIDEKFSDTEEKAQFKRIIRYLKRWKDEMFTTSGNDAPTGIAHTALALEKFKPIVTMDSFTNEKKVNDFEALYNLVDKVISMFWYNGVEVNLPVEPYNDLFEKMSSKQQNNFVEKLKKLREELENAENEPDTVEACNIIQRVLGSDFPVPSKNDTGQQKNKAFSSSTESAL